VNILGFADFHGDIGSAKRASHLVSLEHPSLVVVAGDLANRDVQLARQILEELSTSARKVFFVPGNLDDPTLANWKDTERIACLHAKAVTHNLITFVGLGGSVISPFKTPLEFGEAEASRALAEATQTSSSQNMVLVSHCPPKNTKLDLAGGTRHVGSEAVRRFIDERKPVLVICGHIHEAQGVDSIEGVPVVNVGPARHGHYASILLNQEAKIELRKF